MRVLVFGDSITQGYWDTDGGWVERIRNHYDSLQAGDLEARDEPTIFNLGISADNSKNVMGRIVAETTARTRRGNLPVIIIQIGVNDASTDDLPEGESVSLPVEKYEKNLKLIIDKVKPLCSKIIFVGLSACDETRTTPVAWGKFNYTNRGIKSYENMMKATAETESQAFIPIFDRFKEELDAGKDYLLDGLHPNNAGHTFMAEMILSELDPMLR